MWSPPAVKEEVLCTMARVQRHLTRVKCDGPCDGCQVVPPPPRVASDTTSPSPPHPSSRMLDDAMAGDAMVTALSPSSMSSPTAAMG